MALSAPAFYLAWLAVGGAPSYLPFFFVFVPIVAACNALPISFLGIGVRDISLLYLMRTVGAGDELVIGSTMLILVIRVLNSIILLALGHGLERRTSST